MADIVKLRTGYAVTVSVLRVGFAGPPGAGGAYDDTAVLARVAAVEQSIAALPAPYDDAALAGRVTALEGASVAWTDIADVPATFPSAAHSHEISAVTGLQAALDGKAPASSIWTQEQLQDLVAAMFQSGAHSNASIVYDDASGSLSITASGGGGASLTEEEVEDFVGGLIVQGAGINVTYDDAGNVLSIALSGESFTTAEKNKLAGIASGATANATDAQLRDRSTHTGTQPISSVSGLQAALDGKMGATSFKTINGEVITGSGDIIVSGGTAFGASQAFPELSGKVAGIAIPYNQLSAGGTAWFADLGVRGVPVVRFDAYWDNIQTTKGGAYNWAALDAVVDGLRANGVHVLLVPNNKPAWASSALTDATDRQACADFCGALAAHYVGRVERLAGQPVVALFQALLLTLFALLLHVLHAGEKIDRHVISPSPAGCRDTSPCRRRCWRSSCCTSR